MPETSLRWRPLAYYGYLTLLVLLCLPWLARLVAFALKSDLHSHIVLVPFISGYLLYLRRARLPRNFGTSLSGTITLAAAGLAALAFRGSVPPGDELSLIALAFGAFVAAGGFLFLGSEWMRAALFPMAFLVFLAPLPEAVVHRLESLLVLGSTEAAALNFKIAATPLVRQGTIFELPGIVIRVSQECSGIHSSWVLFLISLLASNVFLKTGWRRVVLVAFVIPLAILRNGFRILVIGLLCVHIGPDMINSVIHRRGGPLFFGLSLIPFGLLLLWLRSREQRLPR